MSNEFVSWNELQKRGQDLQDPELVDNGLGSLLMKGARKSAAAGGVLKGAFKGTVSSFKSKARSAIPGFKKAGTSFQSAGGFKGIAKGVPEAAKKTGQTVGQGVKAVASSVGGAARQGATNVQKGVKGFVSKAGGAAPQFKQGIRGGASFGAMGKQSKGAYAAGTKVGAFGKNLQQRGNAVVRSAKAKLQPVGEAIGRGASAAGGAVKTGIIKSAKWSKANPGKANLIGAGAAGAGTAAFAFKKRKQQ